MPDVLLLLSVVTGFLGIATVASLLLRGRLAERDAIWRAALIAVAAAPLLVVARAGLSTWQWSLPLLPAERAEKVLAPSIEPRAAAAVSATAADQDGNRQQPESATPDRAIAVPFENASRDTLRAARAAAADPQLAPSRSTGSMVSARLWPTVTSILATVWLCGVCLYLARLAAGVWHARQLRNAALPVNDPAALDVLNGIVRDMRPVAGWSRWISRGLFRAPSLGTSSTLEGPIVAGVLRPQILIPQSLLATAERGNLRIALLHECAHLRRLDPACNLLAQLTVAIYWFHPLAHVMNRALRQLREELCDNFVLQQETPVNYAETLLQMSLGNRLASAVPAGLGMFDARRSLETRVQQLLAPNRDLATHAGRGTRASIGIAALLLAASVTLLRIGPSAADDSGTARRRVAQATAPGAKFPEFGGTPLEKVDLHGDKLPAEAAMRLGTWRLRNEPFANGVAFSRDGRLLATTGDGGYIRLWNVPDGSLARELKVSHRQTLYGLAFSPTGNRLAATGGNGEVFLFDIATAAELMSVRHDANGNRVYGVAFAPDGRTFASTGSDWHVRVWDATTGHETFSHNVSGPGHADAFAVAFSPDGRLLAAGYARQIDILDVEKRTVAAKIPRAHPECTVALAFSPDGGSLFSGGSAGDVGGAQLRVWNPLDGSLVRELSAAPRKLSRCAMALSADGATLVSTHYEGLAVWDTASGALLRNLETSDVDGLRTDGVAVAPDGSLVASICKNDGEISVWKTTDLTRAMDFPDAHTGYVRDVTWLPDGDQIVSASFDHTARRWDVATGRQLALLDRGFNGAEAVLVSSAAGELIVAAYGIDRNETNRGVLRFFDIDTGRQAGEARMPFGMSAAAISPDGRRIAVAWGIGARFSEIVSNGQAPTIGVWDVASRKLLGELAGHAGEIIALRFSADGSALASASRDGAFRRWDVEGLRFLSAKLLKEQADDGPDAKDRRNEPTRLQSAGFTPDLSTVLEVPPLGELVSIRRLDATGQEVQCRLGRSDFSEAKIAVSPDGRTAAIGGGRFATYESRIWLIDIASGKLLHEFKPEDWPSSLEFSPDGTRLAAGCRIGTILIYDLPTVVLQRPRS